MQLQILQLQNAIANHLHSISAKGNKAGVRNIFLLCISESSACHQCSLSDIQFGVAILSNHILLFRKELRITESQERRMILRDLIEEVKECSPFSALGFYVINRSTLIATLGTVLTYFIILFQTITCKPTSEA